MVQSTRTDAVRHRPPEAATGASARAARRWFLVLAPALAGACAVVAAAADPGVNQDGAAMYELYADFPGPVQIKSLAYHFSYAFLGVSALMRAGAVRRRGSWPATVAGLLAFLGMTSVPGFLIVDFYDSAIGQAFGVEGNLAVEELMGDMWGLAVMVLSGTVGFLLCLPLAALAAWWAGLLPWWAPVAVVAGLGGGFMVIGANVPGAAVMAAGLVALSVALARSPQLSASAADPGPSS
jgi:hypothetical protein